MPCIIPVWQLAKIVLCILLLAIYTEVNRISQNIVIRWKLQRLCLVLSTNLALYKFLFVFVCDGDV